MFSNSLVNVLVYIAIEQNFRNFVFGKEDKKTTTTISSISIKKQATEPSDVFKSAENKDEKFCVEHQKQKDNQAFEKE